MSKKKILLIDDEKGLTRLVKLAIPQYEVREENDPTRALETAREFQPDLILLDVVMPTMDGGDVAAQFKSDPALAEVPIVFLTAIVTPKPGQPEQSIGGYPFIAKPVSSKKLTEAIEKHLKV
jgi:putative two-component system response regulator